MRLWLACLACAACASSVATRAQQPAANAPGSPAARIQDSIKHLGDSFQVLQALPKGQQKSIIKESNRAFSFALKGSADLDAAEKKLAKRLMVKRPGQFSSKLASFDQTSLPPTTKVRALDLLTQSTQQVVVDRLPAYTDAPPSLGHPAGTAVAVAPCPAQASPIPLDDVTRNTDLLRKVANSVARIEVANDPVFKGTAFVISRSDGVLATACHVVSDFANYDLSNGRWTLPAAAVLADFGETADRLPGREFKVIGVAYVPNLLGCDAALLKVDATALDGSSQLPDAVPIAKPDLYDYSSRIDVATIGYPGLSPAALQAPPLTTTTVKYFTCLKSQQPNIAKYTFGGWADPLEPRDDGEYHIFNHLAPTTGGQSGSPIIALTDQAIGVIGIHYCCTATPATFSGPHQCEQWSVSDHANEAIDLADVLSGAQAAGIISTDIDVPSEQASAANRGLGNVPK